MSRVASAEEVHRLLPKPSADSTPSTHDGAYQFVFALFASLAKIRVDLLYKLEAGPRLRLHG